MILSIEPYYCRRCGKFKKTREIYRSYGQRKERSGIIAEGRLPFCTGCDSPVYEVMPTIRRRLTEMMEEETNGV